ELQQRQRALARRGLHHVLDDPRVLERVARELRGPHERLAQVVHVGRRQEEQAAGQLVQEVLVAGEAIEEVGAHRQHHADRRGVVVGGGEQRREECLARGVVVRQREQLLELVDDDQYL